ncbi:MAG: bacillithiol system redox-active protein YtxJ [Longimicrobiales bacterium]|nr:bacillithiol system redox-active protein YtxJ [Longimicrobiales bacterium]
MSPSPFRPGSLVSLLFLALFVWAFTRLVTGEGGGAEIGLALAAGIVLGRRLPRRARARDFPSLAADGGASALESSGPLLLFKHSTTCPISSVAAREVARFAEAHPDIAVRRVLVIEERSLSNEVAEATGVPHESPQVIFIEGGQVRDHLSHGAVRAKALEGWLDDAEVSPR